MAKAEKFMFSDAFDSPGPVISGDEVYYDNEPKYGDKDLEKARDEAFAEGVTSGIQQSLASCESQMAATVNKVCDGVARLLDGRRALDQALHKEAALLAHAIAGKLAPALLGASPGAEIEALVRDCLIELHDEPRIVIRVNDSQFDDLKRRIDGIASSEKFAGAMVLLAEPEIAPGDCRVEWADGGVERDSQELERSAREAVARYLTMVAATPDAEAGADTGAEAGAETRADDAPASRKEELA